MSDKLEARLSVTGGVLKEALTLLTPYQRSVLSDKLVSLFREVDELWPVERRTVFQQALIDEYEMVLLRLRSGDDELE